MRELPACIQTKSLLSFYDRPQQFTFTLVEGASRQYCLLTLNDLNISHRSEVCNAGRTGRLGGSASRLSASCSVCRRSTSACSRPLL